MDRRSGDRRAGKDAAVVRVAGAVKREDGRCRWAVLRLAAATVALAAVFGAGPGAAREFRAADSQPPTYPSVAALESLAALVAARSEGRHVVRVYDSGQLGTEIEGVELTQAGVIDLDRVNIATFHDMIPETQLLSMPFLFRDEADLIRVLDGPVGAQVLAAFEPHGLIGLAFFETAPRSFYTARGPIRTPADFRGLRIRALPSALMTAMVEAMGATSVYIPYGNVLAGLATGLIDGAENNELSYHETGHYRVAPHLSRTRHTFSPGVLVMSRQSWDLLAENDRRIFRQAAAEVAADLRRRWPERESAAQASVLAEGTEIVDAVDTASFITAMQPVYDRFTVNPVLREMMSRIKAVP